MKLKPIRGFGRKRKQLEQELQETKDTLKQTIDSFTIEKQEYNEKCWKWLCEVSSAREERDKALKKVVKLEEQLKELQSDRYLVRKLPSGRKPKGQSMKVKGASRESNIIKKVKED